MASTKVIDLDSELGISSQADTPTTTRTVKLLGSDVRVVLDLNQFSLMKASGDNTTFGDVMEFLQSMIHPEDWPAFVKVASNHPHLRGDDGAEKLMKVVKRLMEVASEPFPTKQPSDLQRTASTPSTRRKSVASTGSRRAGA